MRDPEAKADFLNMEKRWLLLARSCELGERLDDFTREISRRATSARASKADAMWQASSAAIYSKDTFSRMLSANPACLGLIGKSWDDIRGRNDVEWHTYRVQARNVLSNDRNVLESCQAHEYEEEFDTPQGRRIILSSKAPLVDGEARTIGLVGVSLDITDRKKREEQAELLQREMGHRLMNALTVAQVIARQTINPGDGLHRFEQRLISLARSQELILKGAGRTISLRDLVTAHRLAFTVTDLVAIEGPDVALAADWAIPIGIAIHELATNSVKYGALGGDGQVSITWTLECSGQLPRTLVFHWHELHSRLQTTPAHPGFGHLVLTRIVPRRLNGIASLRLEPGELSWTLRVALTD